jgi:hypothetical protein
MRGGVQIQSCDYYRDLKPRPAALKWKRKWKLEREIMKMLILQRKGTGVLYGNPL